MLSEKFCCYTRKVRQKVIKGIKRSIFYLDVSLSVANGVIPSRAISNRFTSFSYVCTENEIDSVNIRKGNNCSSYPQYS